MSWLIKRFKNGKMALWTTISDGYLHTPTQLTRDQLVEFIKEEYRQEFKKKCEELEKTFPNGWHDKDTLERIEDSRYMSEADWHKLVYDRLVKNKK